MKKEIVLTKSFYDLKSIEEAIKDYKDAAMARIEESTKSFKVSLLPSGSLSAGEQENLASEFGNYVLSIIIAKSQER